MRIKEVINEAVGVDYLYHGSDTDSAKKILSSGYLIGNQAGKQPPSDAQTPLPTVSFSRSWQYELNPSHVNRQPYPVIFVIDRRALETRNKTFSTSQSVDIRGLGWGTGFNSDKKQNINPKVRQTIKGRVSNYTAFLDTNKDGTISPDEANHEPYLYNRYVAAKSGREFEEVVPVKDGKLSIKSSLVGFWINPKTDAASDETLMNHPMRLEQTGPNSFKRANAHGNRNQSEVIPSKSRDLVQRQLDKKKGQERATQLSKVKS